MKFTWDQTDYFAAAVVVACFVYVFKHSGAVEFGALCTLVTGFHGLRIYDQKRPDAQ